MFDLACPHGSGIWHLIADVTLFGTFMSFWFFWLRIKVSEILKRWFKW